MKRKTEKTHRASDVESHESLSVAEPVSLETAIKDFLNAKMAERPVPRTIHDYETHIRYLRNWLDERYPKITLKKITPSILREYVTWTDFRNICQHQLEIPQIHRLKIPQFHRTGQSDYSF